MAIVTPTDRHKSVRNRCVVEGFDGVLCCQVAFCFFLSVGVRAFVIGLSQISSFFSLQSPFWLHSILTHSLCFTVYALLFILNNTVFCKESVMR